MLGESALRPKRGRPAGTHIPAIPGSQHPGGRALQQWPGPPAISMWTGPGEGWARACAAEHGRRRTGRVKKARMAGVRLRAPEESARTGAASLAQSGRLDDVHELGLQGGAAHLRSRHTRQVSGRCMQEEGAEELLSQADLKSKRAGETRHGCRHATSEQQVHKDCDAPGDACMRECRQAGTPDPRLTRKPSMSGCVARSPQFLAVTATPQGWTRLSCSDVSARTRQPEGCARLRALDRELAGHAGNPYGSAYGLGMHHWAAMCRVFSTVLPEAKSLFYCVRCFAVCFAHRSHRR